MLFRWTNMRQSLHWTKFHPAEVETKLGISNISSRPPQPSQEALPKKFPKFFHINHLITDLTTAGSKSESPFFFMKTHMASILSSIGKKNKRNGKKHNAETSAELALRFYSAVVLVYFLATVPWGNQWRSVERLRDPMGSIFWMSFWRWLSVIPRFKARQLGGGNSTFFEKFSPRTLGRWTKCDGCIFFKWVGSSTSLSFCIFQTRRSPVGQIWVEESTFITIYKRIW